MIVFNSMLGVVFLLMLLYRLGTPSALERRSHPIPWKYAVISMGYITFWAALRSGFVDSFAYIRMFETAPTGWDSAVECLGVGKMGFYDFLQILFKTYISNDYHYWLSLIAVLTAIPITITFRKHSDDFLYCIFLFIASTLVIWMFNGIRQFLAASLLFGFTYLIRERKIIKYFIVVYICSLFHTTALIMLPMYFFVTDKPFGKRMMIFVLVVLSCAITITPLMDTMESVLQKTAYEQNLSQFAEDDGVHPLRVLFSAIPVILALFKRKKIYKLNNQVLNICVNMATISAGLYFVGMFTSGIMMGRLPAYFRLYTILLIPFIINYLYPNYRNLFYAGFTVAYLLFYYFMGRNFYYISDILGNYV